LDRANFKADPRWGSAILDTCAKRGKTWPSELTISNRSRTRTMKGPECLGGTGKEETRFPKKYVGGRTNDISIPLISRVGPILEKKNALAEWGGEKVNPSE